jgi:hypothetical protein
MVRVRTIERNPLLQSNDAERGGSERLGARRRWSLVWIALGLTTWLLVMPPARVTRAPLLSAPLLCMLALVGDHVYRARRAPELLAFTWLVAGIFIPLSVVFRFAEPIFFSWRTAARPLDLGLIAALTAVDIACGLLIMYVTDKALLEAAGAAST